MSMLMPPFELHEPTSIREACELKARLPESDFVAGGTDLLPNYKWGLNVRKHVISLAWGEGGSGGEPRAGVRPPMRSVIS